MSNSKKSPQPKIEEVLNLAERGKIHRVVIWEPSRFARNERDVKRFTRIMADGKIREVVSPNGSIKVTGEKLDDGSRWLLSKMVKAVLGRPQIDNCN